MRVLCEKYEIAKLRLRLSTALTSQENRTEIGINFSIFLYVKIKANIEKLKHLTLSNHQLKHCIEVIL